MLYTPNPEKPQYAVDLDIKMRRLDTLNWETEQFRAFLELREHVNKMVASMHELKNMGNFDTVPALRQLEAILNQAVSEIVASSNARNRGYPFNDLRNNQIKNTFLFFQHEHNNAGCRLDSGLNIACNSFGVFVGICSMIPSTLLLGNGSLSVAGMAGVCLGMALFVGGAILVSLAAYSIYVDARSLGDKQIKEIAALVEHITKPQVVEYLAGAEGQPHAALV